MLYPNNSVVALADIGEGFGALYCLTNLTTCCTEADGGSAGEWFLPGQTLPVIDVSQSTDSADFVTSRAPSAVLLNRRTNTTGPTGVFTCQISDESGQNRIAYIQITGNSYMSTDQGQLFLSAILCPYIIMVNFLAFEHTIIISVFGYFWSTRIVNKSKVQCQLAQVPSVPSFGGALALRINHYGNRTMKTFYHKLLTQKQCVTMHVCCCQFLVCTASCSLSYKMMMHGICALLFG